MVDAGVLSTPTTLPPGQRALSTRILVLEKTDGTLKSRLCVRGCHQKHGVDYDADDVYAPAADRISRRARYCRRREEVRRERRHCYSVSERQDAQKIHHLHRTNFSSNHRVGSLSARIKSVVYSSPCTASNKPRASSAASSTHSSRAWDSASATATTVYVAGSSARSSRCWPFTSTTTSSPATTATP